MVIIFIVTAIPRDVGRRRLMGYLLRSVDGILPTCACISYGSVFLALFAYSALSGEDVSRATAPTFDVKRYHPIVRVCIGWAALYYCFLQGQSAAAFWIHKQLRQQASKKDERQNTSVSFADVKYGSIARSNASGLMTTMDRTVGNMLEQTPPFLLGLWLHALTASADDAAWFGWLWLLLRAVYPIAFAHPSMTPALWGVQRSIGISWVSFVTWPSYFVVWRLLIGAGRASW